MKFNLEGLDVVRARALERTNERTMRRLASRRRVESSRGDEDEDDAFG